MKFSGNIDNLKNQLSKGGFSNYNEEQKNGGYCFRFPNGSILNFWPSKGSVNLQGKADDKLSCFIQGLCDNKSNEIIGEPITPAQVEAKGKVFVVHGHDSTAREQLELVLHKLGIEPFVLQNTSGGGLTIIEALEKEIGQNPSEVTFGIVLLTPDDMGYPKSSRPEDAKPRARQNVVLEMGMLLSSIGRSRVAILKKGDLDVPSDASGILYISFNEHVKETVPKLVERLNKSGFKMTPENIARASS
ncbi:nucleotide-binding protein [uncultured Campylobacter sp.]|uniref:nucleotide-binding protein n=1 Tax=uncultured Campylobacter sp. TaxID=218934 RepID=UPI002609EE07|nr:nucleotide-binding protein [uncultured Campylobacter sp.]